MTTENFLNNLSKSEQKVHDYILEKTNASGTGRMSESMSTIASAIGVSEATVHRAIRQLRKSGIIGIIPAQEKTESNEIIYYGEPDEEQQVKDIMNLASQLNSDIDRFQALMEAKDRTIRSMENERSIMMDQIKKQQKELDTYKELVEKMTQIVQSYESENPVFTKNRIVGFTDLGDGNSALIFKEK